MPMLRFGSRYSNVTTFTVATMFAYGFAFFLVGSVAVMSGAKEVQAPLLITLSFATFASGLVGGVMTSTTSHTNGAALAEQRGNAAFVFSNSSGTFITLVSAAAECWEAHAPKDDTGLSLLLKAFRVLDAEPAFWSYFIALIVLAIVALAFVLIGSSRLNRADIEEARKLALVRSCSVILLVIGLAAGTPWGVIPFGAREAADIWSIVGWCTLFFVGAGAFAVGVSHGFGAFFSLLAHGLVHLGNSLASLGTSQRFKIALRQFVVGCLYFVALFAAGRLALGLVGWGTGYLTSIPPAGYDATLAGLSSALTASAIAVSAAGAVIGVVVSCAIVWPSAKTTAARSWSDAKRFLSDAKLFLVKTGRGIHAWLGAQLARLRLVRLPKLKWPHLAWPTSNRARRNWWKGFAGFLSGAARTAGDAASKYGAAYIPRGPRARRTLVAALVVFLAGSFAVRSDSDFMTVDLTVPLPPVTDLPIEPVELAWTPTPVPPALEDVRTTPVPICDIEIGAIDWAFGSDDKLEIPLERCRLPREVRQSQGALVLVGLASSVGNGDLEDRRALRRGASLARWAYYHLENQTDVYVLHLGTAQRVIPLRRYQDLFGKAVGERPVAGLLVRPEPEAATLYSFDVAEQLSAYMVRRGVANDFSRCALYLFRPEAHDEEQLQPVSFFTCRGAQD